MIQVIGELLLENNIYVTRIETEKGKLSKNIIIQ